MPNERTYYVVCADNCKFEGMTKEQIYAAIAEATGSTPTPVDEAFITMIKDQNASANIKVWKGTAAQYNALSSRDANTLYFVDTNRIDGISGVQNDIQTINSEITDLQAEVQPISRGGTGATSAAGAITNLGLTGAEKRTLLWSNASSSSTFTQQTISLNLTNYNYVEIEFSEYSNEFATERHTIRKGDNGVGIIAGRDFRTSGQSLMLQRAVSVSNSGVTFNHGYYSSFTSTAMSDSALIPLRIYGLKEL